MSPHRLWRRLAVTVLALCGLVLVPHGTVAADASANGVRLYRADQIYVYRTLGRPCTEDSFARTCFENGDDSLYVRDKNADGSSAASYFRTSNGRAGACYNPYGNGAMGECDLDFGERATICFYPASIDRSGDDILVYNSGEKRCASVD